MKGGGADLKHITLPARKETGSSSGEEMKTHRPRRISSTDLS